jgi:hypothetical protein
MIFIVRTDAAWADRWENGRGVEVALMRQTPVLVADSDGQVDLFCIGDEAAADVLQAAGWIVVPLRDGWYEDDHGGGVAVWGQGAYWEIRDTPFTILEASGSSSSRSDREGGEALDVRRGIFGV